MRLPAQGCSRAEGLDGLSHMPGLPGCPRPIYSELFLCSQQAVMVQTPRCLHTARHALPGGVLMNSYWTHRTQLKLSCLHHTAHSNNIGGSLLRSPQSWWGRWDRWREVNSEGAGVRRLQFVSHSPPARLLLPCPTHETSLNWFLIGKMWIISVFSNSEGGRENYLRQHIEM